MKYILIILMFMLIPFTVLAGDKIKGTSFHVGDAQAWETGEGSAYFIWHAKGVSHATEGPTGTDPIECHGAGHFDKEGSQVEGICILGAGDDTITQSFKSENGKGQWKYLTGTGKYKGVEGEGTYTHTDLAAGRAIAEWEGEMSLAK